MIPFNRITVSKVYVWYSEYMDGFLLWLSRNMGVLFENFKAAHFEENG